METLTKTIKALVIDDNAPNRMLASELLGIHQIQCDEALEGTSALHMMEKFKYDLVLLDISMPGMDGEEVCRRIRATPGTEELFIVAYTAHAFASETERIRAAGFDALLIKPVSVRSLTEAIEPLLTQ
jgi:CheY-like chemotaxis protein